MAADGEESVAVFFKHTEWLGPELEAKIEALTPAECLALFHYLTGIPHGQSRIQRRARGSGARREALNMASATCKNCGNKVSWRAQHGIRLADRRCDACGGELQGMTAGRKATSQGRKFVRCAACDKRTLHSIVLPIAVRIGWPAQRIIPAGNAVCRWHETRVAEPEAVKFGFLVLEEPPQAERTWGVPIPEYLAKLDEMMTRAKGTRV